MSTSKATTCSIEGCDRTTVARGWCGPHYQRWRRHGSPTWECPPLGACSIEGCERKYNAKGWCGLHYKRWRDHGDPLWEPPTAEARFWSKVDKRGPDDCWPWAGGRYSTGYGQFKSDDVTRLAHRFAYELLVGPVPDGLHLHHTCGNKSCVNPAHLEPLTPAEHSHAHAQDLIASRAAAAVARTTCRRGHPRDTYGHRGQQGWRCRECRRLSWHRCRSQLQE